LIQQFPKLGADIQAINGSVLIISLTGTMITEFPSSLFFSRSKELIFAFNIFEISKFYEEK